MNKTLAFLVVLGMIFSPIATSVAQTAFSVEIASPDSGDELTIGQSVAFSASATGGVAPYDFRWNFGDTNQAFGDSPSHTYTQAGTYTVTLTAEDDQNAQATDSIEVVVTAEEVDELVVVITAPANNSSFTIGQSVTFSASATGGTAPYDFNWTFGDGESAFGQSPDYTYTEAGTYTVTLTAEDNENVQATDSITLTITNNGTPSAPTVNFTVNDSSGPVVITANSTELDLDWTVSDATSCVASGGWTGSKAIPTATELITVGVGSHNFVLTCTGQGGTTADSVAVTVNQPGGGSNAPTVNFTANGQTGTVNISATSTTVALAWTTSDATSCIASDAWAGTKGASGSETSAALGVGSHVFNLACTGDGGTTTKTVTVVLTAPGSVAPIISNVRVTDVTQTTAIVRWQTDIVADSRVIYDTTSHTDISGASAPNYSYANSSATLDVETKVIEHAVQLTGLTPQTQYYFRVLSAS